MATQPPNILIILADDIGVDTFRVNPATKTVTAQVTGQNFTAGPAPLPTFSRMVACGVHFQHAWAHPVCTPTRASLWTGLQPWRSGLGVPGNNDNLPPQTVTGTPVTNITTLAETLAKAGSPYRCAMFGKWDLGSDTNPVARGWDYFAGTFRGSLRFDGQTQYGYPDAGRIGWDRLRNGEGSSTPDKCKAAAATLLQHYSEDFLASNPDLRFYIWEKDIVRKSGDGVIVSTGLGPGERAHPYATTDEIEDAKAWIAANEGRPWCVALNLITPHDPLHVPPRGTFSDETIPPGTTTPNVQQMLVAMTESMDYYVNDLLQAIADQLENTVIIFAGDNGTQDRDTDTGVSIDAQLGDDKSSNAIGGAQVPMIVADGGLLANKAPCYLGGAPRSVAGPVHIIDVFNTVLDIAGVAPPSNDSISMVPHLKQAAGNKREHNFSQMFFLPPGFTGTRLAASVCDSAYRYKLTCTVLTNANFQIVDRNGNVTTAPVFDYQFLSIEPEAGIPGSFTDEPIAGALAPNPDGSFRITNVAYAPKLMELYGALKRERLDGTGRQVPVIHPLPVRIIAKHSHRALDIAGSSLASGGQALQWDFHGGANQQFRAELLDDGYYRLVAEHSGKVLDVYGGSTSAGATLIQWDWHGGNNQRFKLEPLPDGHVRIIAKHSGQVLDVYGGSPENGAIAIQWPWHGGDNQRWLLAGPIVSKRSGKVIDIYGGSTMSGAMIIQWPYHGAPNQIFRPERLDDGCYRLVAQNSGKVLDVAGGSTASGAKLLLWDWHGGNNQRFEIEALPDGCSRIVAKHSGKVLDVAGGSTADGAELIQWDWHGGDNQRWLVRV